MSKSAVFFVPAARCCARVGLLLVAPASPRLCPPPAFAKLRRASEPAAFSLRDDGLPSPRRGVDGAPTDALFLSVAPATRDHPVPGRPGPLSALHRGDFRMRTHEVGSRQWNRSRSDCPRQALMPGGRGPDLPTLRFAPQSWDATPRSAFQDRLRKTPSMSEDGNLCTINSLRSQDINANCSRMSQGPPNDRRATTRSRLALAGPHGHTAVGQRRLDLPTVPSRTCR